MSGLRVVPVTFREACAFVEQHHRHHKPARGHKFSIACVDEAGTMRGVINVGRPVARGWDHKSVAEVNRLCTDGARNACSLLYAAARRAAFAMGYKRLITYILESEPGTSLKAAGFRFVRLTDGGSWSTPSRPREDRAPLDRKQLWEAARA